MPSKTVSVILIFPLPVKRFSFLYDVPLRVQLKTGDPSPVEQISPFNISTPQHLHSPAMSLVWSPSGFL